MKLTPPTMVTFWIAVALGLAGVLGQAGIVAFFAANAFWLVAIGLIVLVLGVLVKGM